MTQVQLADRLGIRKAAVSNVLRGNGNVTAATLAEYLHAMGYEADLTVVAEGEILASMREHRAPRVQIVTRRDQDRLNSPMAALYATQLQGNQGNWDRPLSRSWSNNSQIEGN